MVKEVNPQVVHNFLADVLHDENLQKVKDETAGHQ